MPSQSSTTTSFLTAVQERRSIYTIKKTSPIPNSRIKEIVHHALKYAPSPFNVRSCRCIILFGAEHEKLWNEAYKITEEQTPGAIGILGPKIRQFGEGYGTVCLAIFVYLPSPSGIGISINDHVMISIIYIPSPHNKPNPNTPSPQQVLFFDDSHAYTALTPRFQALSKTYPEWEEHSSGMHQFVVWTALHNEGVGASLQHYQPSITGFVNTTWNVPETWTLKAQLVFGEPTKGPGEEKVKTGLEESLRVFGA
jgi:predicted oxidoreductase (fatty acid repression mutant protein)